MFHAVIHKNVKLAESPSHGKPISGYDRNSRGCKDYMALAREVIEQETRLQQSVQQARSTAHSTTGRGERPASSAVERCRGSAAELKMPDQPPG